MNRDRQECAFLPVVPGLVIVTNRPGRDIYQAQKTPALQKLRHPLAYPMHQRAQFLRRGCLDAVKANVPVGILSINPIKRELIPFPAYSEGWALYAEYLAKEMGLQEDPYDDIGRLQVELVRAVRLVVDTGIHSTRCSREEAIGYMLANTGMAESDVVVEVERYFIMPGHAAAKRWARRSYPNSASASISASSTTCC